MIFFPMIMVQEENVNNQNKKGWCDGWPSCEKNSLSRWSLSLWWLLLVISLCHFLLLWWWRWCLIKMIKKLDWRLMVERSVTKPLPSDDRLPFCLQRKPSRTHMFVSENNIIIISVITVIVIIIIKIIKNTHVYITKTASTSFTPYLSDNFYWSRWEMFFKICKISNDRKY